MVGGMRARGLLAGVMLAGLAVVAQAAAQTPEEIFSRGNAAYEEKRYADAAEAYQTVLKYGIRDSRVEYNLGNAWFRQGELGRAILHYERAKRLDPTDADIRGNLQLARAACFDRVEEPELLPVVRWGRELQDRIGPDSQAWLFLGLVWIIAILVAAKLSRKGGWSSGASWTVASLLVAVLLVAASWYATYERLEGRAEAVVLDEAVEVLAGPGENNPTLFTVHEGLVLEVRAERRTWVQVSLPNGLNGWIRGRAVERI